jgi:hypothetical protein
VDSNLNAGTLYSYRVNAFNTAGKSAPSPTVGAQTEAGTVSGGASAAIDLQASGYKIRGVHNASLSWSGANGTNVDIYRDGRKITTTTNDEAYPDDIGLKGSATYSYKVCEAGTSTCSGDISVVL